MADEIGTDGPTHESEAKRLARECYDQILHAGATVASAVEGDLGGALDFAQIKAGVNRALDAMATHLRPQPAPPASYRAETPSPQVQAAMRQAKKSLEDQLLYVPGSGGSAVVDFNHYNYFQRIPTVAEVFGVAPSPYNTDGYPGPTPEEDAAEAKKIADRIRDQPGFVPRQIGETRHLKFDNIAIRIMRLVGSGDTGTYRIEVDAPNDAWGKPKATVNGRTCSFYPYWASELGLMLEILMLLEKMARALYPDA